MLTYHKTTEEEKEMITAWRYDGEYAIYNLPSYEEMKKAGFRIAGEPVKRVTPIGEGIFYRMILV